MLVTQPRPYQDEAIDAILERGNYLLAYEQGLGKTLCAIAVCEELLGEYDDGFLCALVVPANLKYQWAAALAQHTDVPKTTKKMRVDGVTQEIPVPDTSSCVIIDGPADKREAQYLDVIERRPDYVILGYENVVKDWKFVRKILPDLICIDEATAIKTFRAARTKKIKRWTADFRLALTGTPIENGKPEELFSIMEWVDKSVLGRFDLYDTSFIVRNRFGAVERYRNLPVLWAKLQGVMSRKRATDPDVAPYMPKVTERTVLVDIDDDVRQVYNIIGADLLERLQKAAEQIRGDFDLEAHYRGESDSGSREQGEIMSRLMTLEMLLCDPRLITASAKDYEQSKLEGGNAGSKYAAQVVQSGLLVGIEESHPKLDALIEQTCSILKDSPDSKVIIFSWHRRAGEFIAELLAEQGIGTTPYHGEMTPSRKQASVARFRDDKGTSVMVCSHAAAFGTDLYFADYLINFDLAHSAGTQDQINARHVRAGSLFDHVYVINLICADTVEERKPVVLAFKRRTAAAVIDNRGSDHYGRVENDVPSLTAYLAATLPDGA